MGAKKIFRILRPYGLIVAVQSILLFVFMSYDFKKIITVILTGGIGPGSYYTVVMLQIILLYPFIYKLLKKFGGKSLIFLLILNLAYEVFIVYVNMPVELYRLISIRYIFFITCGAYFKRDCNSKNIVALLIIGILLIYLLNYSEIRMPVFIYWKTTSLPTVFLSMFYFMLMKKIRLKRCGVIEKLSNASFHIFLTQMMYYVTLDNIIYQFVGNLVILKLIINLTICLFFGYIFYVLDSEFHKYINKKRFYI